MNRWASELDKITKNFEESFGTLSQDELNWRPDLHTWSVGQNLQHLIKVNESYFPILQDVIHGRYEPPFTAKSKLLVTFFGKMILRTVDPENKRKFKTFSIWQPTNTEVIEDILARFRDHQEALKNIIDQSAHLAERGAVIASPANGRIAYRLESAFDILVRHERRHGEQARRVLAQLSRVRQRPAAQ